MKYKRIAIGAIVRRQRSDVRKLCRYIVLHRHGQKRNPRDPAERGRHNAPRTISRGSSAA
jgi:hypothetical protein